METNQCKGVGCTHLVPIGAGDLCFYCAQEVTSKKLRTAKELDKQESMSKKYPQYYKDVSELDEIDVYAVHLLFNIQDPSGAIQHASKKLLLSGVRTGGKSSIEDIKEARDTLTRWLQLQELFVS